VPLRNIAPFPRRSPESSKKLFTVVDYRRAVLIGGPESRSPGVAQLIQCLGGVQVTSRTAVKAGAIAQGTIAVSSSAAEFL